MIVGLTAVYGFSFSLPLVNRLSLFSVFVYCNYNATILEFIIDFWRRGAHDDAIDILSSKKREFGEKLRGNIHFFAEDIQTAKKYFDLDFTVSFTGVITFTHDYDEVVEFVPKDRILVETDAPYASPVPNRGKRNEPHNVSWTARRIAEIKKVSFEEISEQTTKNAKELFRI